jgi:predicted Zn-dependent protease with MMP-like domain
MTQNHPPDKWDQLAQHEVNQTLHQLPEPLQTHAKNLPVSYEPYPSPDLEADGIEPDTLGLFVGEPWAETGSTTTPLPPQIILFTQNLRDYAENDETTFLDEVRTTYLHELGHYLGLDEIDLAHRNLD